MTGGRQAIQRLRERRALLCRWLLVGQLAFSQLGSRAASPDQPASAWVQMLPDQPAGWHPLETVDGLTVLTVDHRLEDGAGRGRCPN